MPEENLKLCIIYTIYRYIYCFIYKTLALLRINSHTRSACNQSTPIKTFCIIVDFAHRGIIQQMHIQDNGCFAKWVFYFKGIWLWWWCCASVNGRMDVNVALIDDPEFWEQWNVAEQKILWANCESVRIISKLSPSILSSLIFIILFIIISIIIIIIRIRRLVHFKSAI